LVTMTVTITTMTVTVIAINVTIIVTDACSGGVSGCHTSGTRDITA
jgi:hypothetical protein